MILNDSQQFSTTLNAAATTPHFITFQASIREMRTVKHLVDSLDTGLVFFSGDIHVLTEEQEKALLAFCENLREVAGAKPVSTSTEYYRNRGRDHLRAIFVHPNLGKEVFLQCALRVSFYALSKLRLPELVEGLLVWWKGKTCPPSLREVAKRICEVHSIDDLLKPTLKRQRATPTAKESSAKRPCTGRVRDVQKTILRGSFHWTLDISGTSFQSDTDV
jgi:hypothetical protein